MAADTYQGECTSLFRSLNFYTFKPPDMHFEFKGKVADAGRKVFPADKGRFDMVFTGMEDKGGWVEVKTGTGTAFPFAAVSQDQIDWFNNIAVPRKISAWLFFVVGEKARADWRDCWQEIQTERRSPKTKNKRQMPRLAVLMPFGVFLGMKTALETVYGSKSFSYEEIVAMDHWLLEWHNGEWSLPASHDFNDVFKVLQ